MGFQAGPWLEAAVERGLIAPASLAFEPAPDCSEKDLLAAVVRLAVSTGWLAYHTHDSRGSAPGFPDLVLVRRGVLRFAELKTAKGRFTPEQSRWLAALAEVPGVFVSRWRPADWSTIARALA